MEIYWGVRRNPQHPARSVWVRPAKGGSQGDHVHASGESRKRFDHPRSCPRAGNPSIRRLAGASRPGRRLGRSLARRRRVNFATRQMLWVHLEELNTSENIANGAPSTLLAGIGLGRHAFGDINTVRMECPEYKRLRDGTISELKVSIRDASGKAISNQDLPIHVTLELVARK